MKQIVFQLSNLFRTTSNATAPRPIRATSAPKPGCVGVLAGVAVVVGGTVVTVVIGAAVVTTVVVTAVGAGPSRTLNSAVPVASWRTAVAVTMYSSGLNVDASTSNEILFRPPSPFVTLTVPVAPLNSPLWLF
jgi:hypothetical protein